MEAQFLVGEQLKNWHQFMLAMLADATAESVNKAPGGTLPSIAAIYAHTVFAEDAFVNATFQGRELLYVSGGFDKACGIEFPGVPPMQTPEWSGAVSMDPAVFGEYGRQMFAATDAYLESLTDADMEREITTHFGKQKLGWMLSVVVATHLPQHAGEIAAIRGMAGLKGLPF